MTSTRILTLAPSASRNCALHIMSFNRIVPCVPNPRSSNLKSPVTRAVRLSTLIPGIASIGWSTRNRRATSDSSRTTTTSMSRDASAFSALHLSAHLNKTSSSAEAVILTYIFTFSPRRPLKTLMSRSAFRTFCCPLAPMKKWRCAEARKPRLGKAPDPSIHFQPLRAISATESSSFIFKNDHLRGDATKTTLPAPSKLCEPLFLRENVSAIVMSSGSSPQKTFTARKCTGLSPILHIPFLKDNRSQMKNLFTSSTPKSTTTATIT